MRAMEITAFGGPEVFQAADLPIPEPGQGEMRVRVLASSVNPVDFKLRRNGTWAGLTTPALLGYDVAGVVDKLGPNASRFRVGDKVFYTPLIFGGHAGSYAEYHVVREDIVALKPSNLTFEEAASIPLAGCTALDALVSLARLNVGETALIHAGAGGVGSLAVQIAKAAGARVLATASRANAELAKQLGADVVIDYRSEDFVEVARRETGGKGVDVGFDTVGGETLSKTVDAMKPHGRMVSVVNTTGNLNSAYIKNLSLHFLFMERDGAKMESLRIMAERNQLKPVIDSILPLEAVADAHRKIESGGMRGKIVLRVADGADQR